MFERIPSGTTVFLDANVFLYHALEARPSCALLFHRIKIRELRAATSTVVVGEVLHRLILAEAAERFRLPSSRAALNLLRRHPEHVATLTSARDFVLQMPWLRIRTLSIAWREIVLAGELSQRHHLLTNDALIVATMTYHRLTHLATNDEDFRRVPHITIWRP